MSTLAASSPGVVDPSGTVGVVGSKSTVDITHLRADDLRAVIGRCAQDAYIFDSTREANLRLARPDATVEQLRDALDRASLMEFVQSLPNGPHTMVGGMAERCPAGSVKRLALARTLLADRPIVILDEPTEHLDNRPQRHSPLTSSTTDRSGTRR